jgi:D-sedoheptulose 7-phosphate isomerase
LINSKDIIKNEILESVKIIEKSLDSIDIIDEIIKKIITCLKNGRKIVVFGNGGSAADSQHIAAELIGRFQKERKSIPAISLTTDSSIITSIANDYSYDEVFSRQCESIVLEGDVVIGISTSGNSKNVEKGIKMSKSKGAITIGLLGNGGGNIKKIVDISLEAPSTNTAKIQEIHRVVYHIICKRVEEEIAKNETSES